MYSPKGLGSIVPSLFYFSAERSGLSASGQLLGIDSRAGVAYTADGYTTSPDL